MPDKWYIARGKQKEGPLDFIELQELARTGGLLPTEMVLRDGATKWQPASQIEGLFWVTDWEPDLPSLETSEPRRQRTLAQIPEAAPHSNGAATKTLPEAVIPCAIPLEQESTPQPDVAAETPPPPAVALEEPPPQPEAKPQRAAKRRPALLVWSAAAIGLSITLGLVGDFFQPMFAFNLIAFVVAVGLAVASLVLWAKNVGGHASSFRRGFFIFICVAVGFGSWWGMAYFNGGREKGLLAAHSRFVARLQSAVVGPTHGEQLFGAWVLGSDESPDAELDIQDGRLTWRFGSRTRIEAEYGTTKGGVVYGIITHVESGVKRPEVDDTFSFWFRAEQDTLTIKELKGSGIDEIKKDAQGRYKKRR